MVLTDIIKYVNKYFGTDDNILEIIDEVNSFMLEKMPDISWQFVYEIAMKYSGTATSTAATMTDSTAAFATDGTLIGQTINNTTDGSSGTITAATATVITATLSGGTANTWADGDAYTISMSNNIKIPKTINAIDAVFVDDNRIWGSLPITAKMNVGGTNVDPYSGTSNEQTGSSQAVVIRDDYRLFFVTALAGTTMKLLCSKMSNELTYSDIASATELDLPNKFIPAIAFFVLSRLYGYKKYFEPSRIEYWSGKFESEYKKAKSPVGRERFGRLNLGKDSGVYSFQKYKTI